MRVYLIRHAQPIPENMGHGRPLSDQGREEIKRFAEFAKAHLHIRVPSIFHSPKLRAIQTAEILAEYLNPAEGLIQMDGLKPMDDPRIWAARLADADDNVMLVSHLPFLNRLAGELLTRDRERRIVDFPTSGAACLSRQLRDDWLLKWFIDSGHL